MKLRLDESAAEAMELARNWWRANRDKAPLLFQQELERACEAICEAPLLVGALDRRTGVRRYVMPKTQYLVFYMLEGDTVRIVHFRHARQRPLKALR